MQRESYFILQNLYRKQNSIHHPKIDKINHAYQSKGFPEIKRRVYY